jgi:hypothetical protein
MIQIVDMNNNTFYLLLKILLEWAYKEIKTRNKEEVVEGDCLCSIIQVHGMKDYVIPCKCVKPDIIILNGGHLLPVNNSSEFNMIIEKYLSSYPTVVLPPNVKV